MLFICYSKCSTCKKAQQWLDDNGLEYTVRDIKTMNPSYAELKKWVSTINVKRLWNTSGMLYRSLGIKDKLPVMNEEDQLALLASDGMLVKRPILVTDKIVLVGFKENEWEAALLNR
jgi:arsenate reductase